MLATVETAYRSTSTAFRQRRTSPVMATVIRMHRFAGTRQRAAVPTQTWNASHIQWDGGTCAGFVRSVEKTLPGRDASVPMTYWDQQDLPFYYGLAQDVPAGDPMVLVLSRPDVPQPAIPRRGHRERADR